jgi:lysophospholipase L1-like esterase
MVSKHLNSSQKVVDIINAGLNGDFVLNVLRRLDDAIKCKPDFVTIMIGNNDARAVFAPDVIDAFRKFKKVPLEPEYWTIQKYREDLTEIISRLKKDTNAKIAILSIPTIGENFNHPVFDLSLEFARTIKVVASETNVTYLPLSEKMVDYLKEHSSNEKYPYEEGMKMMIRALFAHYFGRSWEKIARKNGCHLHVDHLHLNKTGASMVADLITNFYKENT